MRTALRLTPAARPVLKSTVVTAGTTVVKLVADVIAATLTTLTEPGACAALAVNSPSFATITFVPSGVNLTASG